MTFLTPTAITGDRSLVSLIAHELAHSWSGNLATNSTWNDVWLNEGMTTYVEIQSDEALAWLAWSGASGGAHGRRRGMAHGRPRDGGCHRR